ncbi:MAG: trypsin-like peptidase domain-containing protein [Caldilineaceae bacterium]|nr:trypsin-like peptidase domain-containing protein [Caldilineaceae bacterium]
MKAAPRLVPMLAAVGLALLMLGPWQTAAAAHEVRSAPAQRIPTPGNDDDSADDPAVTELADVQDAVVRIEAVGTFVDPEEGMLANAAGSGTGFIIDEAGIAVTNNHVVTGGALYRVYVAGEEEPRNARVLGVSECADLAVIDIQGDGFPYLTWMEGNIRVGLDVYAAGFPLGDPEYTLTRGIVAKAAADGESQWASVDQVLQHDADIVPGNSGGPLVDSDGRVVGVNYRLNQAGQYFAISRDEARPLIERLRAGENVDSIGINGEAVSVGDDLTGIWIASVDSGSVADEAGLLPGDVLLTMEGLDLGVNGTLETYCDILRSHDLTDVLSIEVLRFDTQEVLEGQLNGRTLAQSFSFAESAEEEGVTGSEPSTDTADYTDFVTVTDEQGIIAFEAPAAWQDVQEQTWTNSDDEEIGLQLLAVPDLDAFYEDWGIPGIIFSYSDTLEDVSAADLAESIDYSETCTYVGRETLPDGYYTGEYDIYEECGESGSSVIIMGLIPETGDYLLRIEAYTTDAADFDAIDRMLDTFLITPPGSASAQGEDEDVGTVYATLDEIDTSGLIDDYVMVESDAATALLPDRWDDMVSTEWVEGSDFITATLSAAADVQQYNDTWGEAGVTIFSAIGDSSEMDPLDLLDESDLSEYCTYSERVAHLHTIYGITYQGAYDIWTDCGGEANVFVVLAAVADTNDHGVRIYFLGNEDADVEAFHTLQSSFYVLTDATASRIGEQAGVSGEEASFDPADYTTVADEEGALSMSIPLAWDDVVNDDWVIDGDVIGRAITAASDAASFEDTWETPGVFAGVSSAIAESFTPEEIADLLDYSDECVYDDRYDYASDALEGVYDIWLDCGDSEGTVFINLAANPVGDSSQLLLLYAYLVSDSDGVAFEQIMNTIAVGDQERSDNRLPTATVVTAALNVRNGPGTNYARVAAVNEGDELIVSGQNGECAWLLVFTPGGQIGWVSGNSRYTTLNGECAGIPAVDAPAQQNGSGSQAASGQGCYTFQNLLGAELTITFTRQSDKWNTTFKVAPDGENRQCFDPGQYTYTLDAPPPWGSSNGELNVGPGDNFAFPIYGE